MNKLLQKQNGMTLVELLGAIVIMGIITALTFPILLGGMKTTKDIQKETMLRDEADYLMAAVIKELYTTKESEIIAKEFPQSGTANYYFKTSDGKKTGFIDNKLQVEDRIINTSNNAIRLLPSEIRDLEEGQYEIILKLKLNGRTLKEMEFKNVIRTINDIEKEEAS